MDHVIALAIRRPSFSPPSKPATPIGSVSRGRVSRRPVATSVKFFGRPPLFSSTFVLSLSLSSLSRSLPFVGEIALGTRIKNKSRRNYLYGLVTSLLSSRQFISSDVFTLGFVELRSSTSARDSFPILPESLLSKKCAR